MGTRSRRILAMLNLSSKDADLETQVSSSGVVPPSANLGEECASVSDLCRDKSISKEVDEINIVEADSSTSSVIASKINISSGSPSGSISEDKESDPEYIPMTDSGTTTEEEITIPEKKIKVKVHKRIKNGKRLKINSNMKKKISNSTPETLELVSSAVDSEEVGKNNIIVVAANKRNGKLIRNKIHACYFCQKVVQNSARHLELIHKKETEVARLLAKPKLSKERRDGFINLIRAGDFYYNTDVLSTGRGQLILVRRPTEDEAKFVTPSAYGPCPHCLGFMLKKHLWHHVKNSCSTKVRNDAEKHTHIIAESNALLSDTFGTELSKEFIANIFSKLRDDNIGIRCKEDALIQRFGAMLFEKYGITQCELIRQSMRQLARLTLRLQDIANSKQSLSDFLSPQSFDLIIKATKSLCLTHQNSVQRPEFEIPSLALKIGYALKKCAGIKRGSNLRAGNLLGNETLNNFLTLMELEWSTRISSNALATLYNRKMNSTQLLPLTSDLIKLSQYFEREIKRLQESLAKSPSVKEWSTLASLTLGKVILFNKRRSGEASRMTISDYNSRPKWSDQCTMELKKSLTNFEKKLADQLTLIEIIGKRGRKVPVLLTQDVKISIDQLNLIRDKVNIAKENPFVFARTSNSTANMKGHDCLRKACSDAGLEHAENITSTKLRKYIATVCQVFNLSENDYDWLARHLGHDIRVHREFYRLHESAVELTKVSRILIAVDKGEVNSFAGKKLEDINLEDIPNADESEEEDEEKEKEDDDCDDNANNELMAVKKINLEYKEQTNAAKTGVSSKLALAAPREAQAKALKVNRRCPWSSEEKEIVLKFFKTSIKNNILPGKADCTKCKQENDILSRRTWTDIKFCVKNHLDKIKKLRK